MCVGVSNVEGGLDERNRGSDETEAKLRLQQLRAEQKSSAERRGGRERKERERELTRRECAPILVHIGIRERLVNACAWSRT